MENRNFGRAWTLLTLALLLHVTDEALTGFLDVYNPTVLALRARVAWLPVPVFSFRLWLAALLVACALLFWLGRFAFQGARWLRPVAYAFAGIMTLNAAGHTAGTIAGRSFFSIPINRSPMPGFYSSPFLLAASINLFWRLRVSRRLPS